MESRGHAAASVLVRASHPGHIRTCNTVTGVQGPSSLTTAQLHAVCGIPHSTLAVIKYNI